MSRTDGGSNWIHLQLDYGESLRCLLSNPNSAYRAKICWDKTSNVNNSCDHNWRVANCQEVGVSGSVNVTQIHPSTMYTFYALVVGGSHNVCSLGLIWSTNKATPTVNILHSSVVAGSQRSKFSIHINIIFDILESVSVIVTKVLCLLNN